MRLIRPIVAIIFAAISSFAAEKWIRVTSPNFELYTSHGEKKARDTILYFEQIREFFEKTSNIRQDSRVPVRIILFASEQQYKPYRPNEIAAAYYQRGQDRDYVVIGSSQESERVAIHEYVHLMVQHAGITLPIWLNEGTAELYSTLRPLGNKVFIGTPIPGRLYELQGASIPIARLLDVGHASVEYNRKSHAGVFYAESWALTHMLQLTKEYRPKFNEFYHAVVRGENSREAMEKAYGRSIADIEKDLMAYVRNNDRFMGIAVPIKFEKADMKPDVSPVDAVVAKAVCTSILISTRQMKEAEPALKELEAESKRPEVAETLAYAYWRSGDLPKARAMFDQAIASDHPHPKLMMNAAKLAMRSGSNDQKAIDLMNKVLENDPEWTEARIQLAEELLARRRNGEALVEVRKIKKVEERFACQLFRIAAYAEAAIGDMEHATKSADSSAKYAKQMWEKEAVTRLREYLTRVQEVKSRPSAPSVQPVSAEELAADDSFDRDDLDTKPRLVRRSASGDERIIQVAVGEQVEAVEGILSQVDCLDGKARLYIDGGKGKVALAIHDPSSIIVRGADNKEGHFELQCGPQKQKIRADYVVAEDAKNGTQGVLKIIEVVR